MAVLDFAAHTLDYLEVVQGHDDEETGDYVKGSSSWVEGYCKCDIVPAGKANTITIPDGQTEPYEYTIYNLPRSCREFKYGETIRIRFYGGEEVREFTVKGFHRYQMQCKIWV